MRLGMLDRVDVLSGRCYSSGGRAGGGRDIIACMCVFYCGYCGGCGGGGVVVVVIVEGAWGMASLIVLSGGGGAVSFFLARCCVPDTSPCVNTCSVYDIG